MTETKHTSALPGGTAGVLAVLLAAGLAAGSIWDQPLSTALYDGTNLFGRFFAAFGEYPMALGAALAGGLLWAGRDTAHRVRGAWQAAGAVLLLVFAVLVGAFFPARYSFFPLAAEFLISICAAAAAGCCGCRLGRRVGAEKARRAALFVFVFILSEYLAVTLVKELWSRPRFRLVALGTGAEFVPWWQPQSPFRALMTAAGVRSEEFRSFPSGHTANAALMLGLALLPRLDERLAGRERLLFWCGAAYAAVVALSRIIVGAHYLSDTVCGCAFTLAALYLTQRWLCGREKRQ